MSGNITGGNITFKRPDGKDAHGYLVKAARADAPGIVVVQEWWGLQGQIKGICDRFAASGYTALAPDLYAGTVVPYHDKEAAAREMNSLNFLDATDQTVRGAVLHLKKNGAKVVEISPRQVVRGEVVERPQLPQGDPMTQLVQLMILEKVENMRKGDRE